MGLVNFGLRPMTYAAPPSLTGTVAPTMLTPQVGYTRTSLSLSSAATAAPSTAVSISSLVEDSTIASRWSTFGITTSDRLLSVGGKSKIGRWCLKLLAGSVPFVTDSAVRQDISNKVDKWLGQADLLRTGMQVYQAKTMQNVSVYSTLDLANYASAYDQSVLLQRYAAASGGYGVPSPQELAAWVSIAQSSPSKLA